MMVAIVNLIPAKMKGGRNAKPIFIPSHVEPQMRQRAAKTRLGALDCKSVQIPCARELLHIFQRSKLTELMFVIPMSI